MDCCDEKEKEKNYKEEKLKFSKKKVHFIVNNK